MVILWHSPGITLTFFLLAGIGAAVILSVLIWIIIQLLHSGEWRRSVLNAEEVRLEYSYLRKVAGLPAKFGYEALEAATDNFQLLIGRGSSGSIFKGVLNDGTVVAVKRIERSEHGDSEFRSEVAAIGSVQHTNLVRLLGYCLVPRSELRFLVYEFVENGSLDKWIFPRTGQERQCLPWAKRYRAAVDVARALAYLHEDCRSRVLHLDVKPENVLLDARFRALVSDFGLSKLMRKDESRILTTVRGTRGYLAPEWFMGRGVSEKCDVFSYGMLLLELVAGRRSIRALGDGEWSYLPKVVMEKVSGGRTMEVVDERLRRIGVDEREVRQVVHTALWCVREDARMRPSMEEVVVMLNGRTNVEAPPMETDMLILDMLMAEHVSVVAGEEHVGHGGVDLGRVVELGCQAHVSLAYSMPTTVLSGR